jgi:hypothetical protein
VAPCGHARVPDAQTNGAALLVAVIPDEHPELEPTVRVHGRDVVVPYEIMRWFMEQVTEEVRRAPVISLRCCA